jgi:DNA-directed RNA polymerase specialized sigma24 family protein
VLLRALAVATETQYAQIAEALDMAVGSIGPTRQRCLQQLRAQLAAAGIG